jgi:propanol-preferring alcohol dehydrogenase
MRLGAQASIERSPLRLEEVAIPDPLPDEVLVRVSVCGLCRTDLHVVEGDLPLRRVPIVPGHQIVGRVVRAGAETSRFHPGDRVGIAWLRRTCGHCRFCRGGRENLCEQPEFTGWTADGGFAEYASVPEAFAYAIPGPFDDTQAAPLLCAGIIGYRALRRSAVAPGGRLAIYGFGSSAHVTIQVAVARGIEVYVATREPVRRAHARALGARWAGELGDRMPHPTDGAIIFAPAGDIVTAALANLDRGGTLALAGIYMTPIPSLPYPAVFDERVITTVTANTRQDGEELLAEAARIPVRPVVTPFPLEEVNRGLDLVKRGEVEGTGVLVLDGVP